MPTPQYDPNDPHWWSREPEIEIPEVEERTGLISHAGEIQYLAEGLLTNTAMISRAEIEYYVRVRHKTEELNAFLRLLLDRRFDGSLYDHMPPDYKEELMQDDPEEMEELRIRLNKKTPEELVRFFDLNNLAEALELLRSKNQ